MRRPESAVLSFLPEEEKEAAFDFMFQVILYTDMKLHNGLIEDLKKFKEEAKTFENLLEENRVHLFRIILHCSDLQNPAKPFDLAVAWGGKISQEFYNQVQNEKKLGLPVTPFMEGLEDIMIVYK